MHLDGLLEGLRLKTVVRAGWLRVGVHTPESVADHSWGMVWLVLQLCPPELSLERALAIAALHDLPEVRVGDITPHDGITKQAKHQMEAEAARDLFADRPALLSLWRDYAEQSSPEARFVRDVDKLEMALQALLYANEADTREFVTSAARSAQTPLVKALIDEVSVRLAQSA